MNEKINIKALILGVVILLFSHNFPSGTTATYLLGAIGVVISLFSFLKNPYKTEQE